MLKVNEIYCSIQGESSFAGLPCVFIRLTYCNLRCNYCDTEYAFHEGSEMSIEGIVDKVLAYKTDLVELTGGEPLFQEESSKLIEVLCDKRLNVLIETSGSISIENIDKRATLIMDLKCPSSLMMKKNLYSNLEFIKSTDEIKFVLADRGDYDWMKNIIDEYALNLKTNILVSCVFNKVEPKQVVEWILEDKLQVRFQLQLHKYIWNPELKGV